METKRQKPSEDYKSKDWLYEHYVVLQESTAIMAQEAGCGRATIGNWLHKFNIPTRTHGESSLLFNARGFQPYRNENWLHGHYVDLQESTYAMAQRANCSQGTICGWLRKFNIPVRSSFETNRNHLTISQELLDLLEGELLGDGYTRMNGSRSSLYAHSSKYEEYLIWLSRTFADLGLGQVGKINRYWSERDSSFGYRYASKSYPELVSIRQRWYPDGKKIVPKDLELNPIMARQWFIGDGGLYNHAGRRPHIEFATYDFDKASIDHLLKELRDNGFKVNHRPSNNTIGMSVESVQDFLDWIGPCPKKIENIYGYKWDYQDNRKSTKVRHYYPRENLGTLTIL